MDTSLLTKALTKHFKKLIKAVQAEHFSVSSLKGTAKLTDLGNVPFWNPFRQFQDFLWIGRPELDEILIKDVMMHPPNTEIRSCTCNELTISETRILPFRLPLT